jgi:hypothetical protein
MATDIKVQFLKQRQIIIRPQPFAICKLVACDLIPFSFRISQKINTGYTIVLMLEVIAEINEVNCNAILLENPFGFIQHPLDISLVDMFKNGVGDMIIDAGIGKNL